MSELLLAYDLGTGGTKASLHDAEGRCLATAFVSYETAYPGPSRHEQRPEDWWDSVVSVTRKILGSAAAPAERTART